MKEKKQEINTVCTKHGLSCRPASVVAPTKEACQFGLAKLPTTQFVFSLFKMMHIETLF